VLGRKETRETAPVFPTFDRSEDVITADERPKRR
jgi:hypothetical protein